jgi:hypothetical protein
MQFQFNGKLFYLMCARHSVGLLYLYNFVHVGGKLRWCTCTSGNLINYAAFLASYFIIAYSFNNKGTA